MSDKKQCGACLQLLSYLLFHKDAATKDGYCARCKVCFKDRRPVVRKRHQCVKCNTSISLRSVYCSKHLAEHRYVVYKKDFCKRYEKTETGFLMRAYRNMKSRVTGVQHKKAHLYSGKEILTKEEFYSWAKASDSFRLLFESWERANYNRKLSPSVDRIDSSKGYTVDNMRWLTHSQNSSFGTISRFKKAA